MTDSFCGNCGYNLGADDFNQNWFCKNSGKLYIQFKGKETASTGAVRMIS